SRQIFRARRGKRAPMKRSLVVLSCAVLPSLAAAHTAFVSGDAHVNSGSPGSSYGGATTLSASAPNYRALVRFDLSTVPGGSSVAKATVRLWVRAVNTPG